MDYLAACNLLAETDHHYKKEGGTGQEEIGSSRPVLSLPT
jgi:hypothetical protein